MFDEEDILEMTDKHVQFCKWLLMEDMRLQSRLYYSLHDFKSSMGGFSVKYLIHAIAQKEVQSYGVRIHKKLNEYFMQYEHDIIYEWNRRHEPINFKIP